jgi:hypothetical protein
MSDEVSDETGLRLAKEAAKMMREACEYLGESPEAWRGAVFVAANVREILTLAMSEMIDGTTREQGQVMHALVCCLTGLARGVLDSPGAQAITGERF